MNTTSISGALTVAAAMLLVGCETGRQGHRGGPLIASSAHVHPRISYHRCAPGATLCTVDVKVKLDPQDSTKCLFEVADVVVVYRASRVVWRLTQDSIQRDFLFANDPVLIQGNQFDDNPGNPGRPQFDNASTNTAKTEHGKDSKNEVSKVLKYSIFVTKANSALLCELDPMIINRG